MLSARAMEFIAHQTKRGQIYELECSISPPPPKKKKEQTSKGLIYRVAQKECNDFRFCIPKIAQSIRKIGSNSVTTIFQSD